MNDCLNKVPWFSSSVVLSFYSFTVLLLPGSLGLEFYSSLVTLVLYGMVL